MHSKNKLIFGYDKNAKGLDKFVFNPLNLNGKAENVKWGAKSKSDQEQSISEKNKQEAQTRAEISDSAKT